MVHKNSHKDITISTTKKFSLWITITRDTHWQAESNN